MQVYWARTSLSSLVTFKHFCLTQLDSELSASLETKDFLCVCIVEKVLLRGCFKGIVTPKMTSILSLFTHDYFTFFFCGTENVKFWKVSLFSVWLQAFTLQSFPFFVKLSHWSNMKVSRCRKNCNFGVTIPLRCPSVCESVLFDPLNVLLTVCFV